MKTQRNMRSILSILATLLHSGCTEQRSAPPTPESSLMQKATEKKLAPPLPMPKYATERAIAETYQGIPHRRTLFDFNSTRMSKQEAAYLRVTFALIEQGTVVRCTLVKTPKSKPEQFLKPFEQYEQSLAFLNQLEVPERLSSYHQNIIAAFNEQQAFFKERPSGKIQSSELRNNKYVHKSSQALQKAYGILMRLYPEENKHNKKAFFDYHCAFDFI